jgi:flagellar assembly factor FliW
LEVAPDDILHFPAGLIGLEDCRSWVLLADAQNDALGWLQCTTRPDLAVAVVSPRRFVPAFQIRVYRSELAPLELAQVNQAQILAIVGKHERSLTLNLKAPIVVNLARRLGRQVITNGDAPLQYEFHLEPLPLRKSA